MHSRYNRRISKALSERGKRMAAARWRYHRERLDAETPARLREIEDIKRANLPRRQGDPLGCLQWTDFRTGRVRRWIIRIGDRVDRVTMHSPDGRATRSHGWTWIMNRLRSYLSGRKN